jgi:hypothetical protein
MSCTNKSSLLLALALAVGIGLAPTFAREQTPNTTDAVSSADGGLDPTLKSALTPGFLQTKIKETETATDRDDTAKAKLSEQYHKALSALEAEQPARLRISEGESPSTVSCPRTDG